MSIFLAKKKQNNVVLPTKCSIFRITYENVRDSICFYLC